LCGESSVNTVFSHRHELRYRVGDEKALLALMSLYRQLSPLLTLGALPRTVRPAIAFTSTMPLAERWRRDIAAVRAAAPAHERVDARTLVLRALDAVLDAHETSLTKLPRARLVPTNARVDAYVRVTPHVTNAFVRHKRRCACVSRAWVYSTLMRGAYHSSTCATTGSL
jgi:hypothetical protein